jgi:uncharacterized repeat protein (TIGR01451 family)
MKPSTLLMLIILIASPVGAGADGIITDEPHGFVQRVPIPDCHPGGIISRQTISGCDTIEDLDVVLEINHQWTGDLVVSLESPSGTLVTLVDRPGFDGSGYGCQFAGLSAVLDDEATLALEDQCNDDGGGTTPSISGTLIPNNPLSAFDGELGSGVWTLRVSDWAEENTGKLMNWQLIFDCSSRDVDLRPELFADRTWARPGDTVIFTLRLVNAGGEAASGVEVAYELSDGFDWLWAEPGALADGAMITQRHGSLAPGETVEARLALTVTDVQWGLLKVSALVRADQTDSYPWNDQVSAGVRVGFGSAGSTVGDGHGNVEIKQ